MNRIQHEKLFGKGKLQNRKLFRDAMKSDELLNSLLYLFPSREEANGREAWQYTDEDIVDEARWLYSFWWIEEGTTMKEHRDSDYYRTVRQLKSFLKKHGQSFPKVCYDLVKIDGQYY